MKFDGIVFRRAPKICRIPIENPDPKHKDYAVFGKLIPKGQDIPASAKLVPHISWSDEAGLPASAKTPVYANIIPCDGYSLTNMMYGKDGKIYLVLNGVCYVAPGKKKDLTRDAVLALIRPQLPNKTVGLRKQHDGTHKIIASEPGCGFGYAVGVGLTWQQAYDDFLKLKAEVP